MRQIKRSPPIFGEFREHSGDIGEGTGRFVIARGSGAIIYTNRRISDGRHHNLAIGVMFHEARTLYRKSNNARAMNRYSRILSTRTAVKPQKDSSRRKAASNDVELFASFLHGNNPAFVELFDRHNHRLYLYCLQFVNDPQQAEDITQEIWERVIRLRSEDSTEVHNPMGLLLTIARNLCIDAVRKDRHHAGLDDIPESSHPVANTHEMSHLEELVILALPHLPVAQREVLALFAYSGYRFDEIAEMLGEPVGAIRTRAWRARAHLGRIISAMIGLDDDHDKAEGYDIPGGKR